MATESFRPEDWAAAAGFRVVRALGAGPVADSWLLQRGAARFVLRRDRPVARRIGLDRHVERAWLRWAHGAGLGPEPLQADAPGGVLLTRFLPGEAWERWASPGGTPLWAALGRLLRRVHDHEGPAGPRFDLEAIAGRYAETAGTGEAARLARRVTARARPLYADAPWRPCHHDAHLGNVVGAARPRLLDWEYAALGHPVFDLAVVVRFHGLGEAATRALLVGWSGSQTPPSAVTLGTFCALYDDLARLWRLAVDAARD